MVALGKGRKSTPCADKESWDAGSDACWACYSVTCETESSVGGVWRRQSDTCNVTSCVRLLYGGGGAVASIIGDAVTRGIREHAQI